VLAEACLDRPAFLRALRRSFRRRPEPDGRGRDLCGLSRAPVAACHRPRGAALRRCEPRSHSRLQACRSYARGPAFRQMADARRRGCAGRRRPACARAAALDALALATLQPGGPARPGTFPRKRGGMRARPAGTRSAHADPGDARPPAASAQRASGFLDPRPASGIGEGGLHCARRRRADDRRHARRVRAYAPSGGGGGSPGRDAGTGRSHFGLRGIGWTGNRPATRLSSMYRRFP